MFEIEREVAGKAARSAGERLNHIFGNVQHVQKKGAIDLVTEADLAAEKIILEILQDHFPKDNILSEEAGAFERSSGRTWIIDPLDGTTGLWLPHGRRGSGSASGEHSRFHRP